MVSLKLEAFVRSNLGLHRLKRDDIFEVERRTPNHKRGTFVRTLLSDLAATPFRQERPVAPQSKETPTCFVLQLPRRAPRDRNCQKCSLPTRPKPVDESGG